MHAFSCGNGNDPNGCICCCHLQLAAYMILFISVLYNAMTMYTNATTGQWSQIDEKYQFYDIILVIYHGITLIINILCFWGIKECTSNYILPQVYIVASYVIIIIVNTIIRFKELTASGVQVFDGVLVLAICMWITWIYYKVYLWAYYFEHGGKYENDMVKPPGKSRMKSYIKNNANNGQQVVAQPAEIQPAEVPQDGVGDGNIR